MSARPRAIDGYSFAIAFKGVLLEGLEVAFIVLTFGANQHRVGLAAAAAGAGDRPGRARQDSPRGRPLARVPENSMKFSVGVMLTAFGTFWGAEGAGASWPGGDAALLVIDPRHCCWSALGMVSWLKAVSRPGEPSPRERATVGEAA